jgi:hypothetical protein
MDKYVAELLAEEAQAKDKNYRISGLDAFSQSKR